MNVSTYMKIIYIKFRLYFRESSIKVFQNLLFRKQNNIKKVVIHRVSAFGDAVVSLPAISMIRDNYPNAQIDIVSTNSLGINIKNILQDSTLVDNIYIYSREEMKKAIQKIKDEKYDLYIEIPQNLNLYKTFRNMIVVKFVFNINMAFGWDKGRLKSFLDIQKQYFEIDKEVDRFIKILLRNGLFKYGQPNFSIPISRHIEYKVKDFLQFNDYKNIVFLIGGKLSSKKWPLDNWSKLLKKLEGNFNIYILGGSDEFLDAEYILSNSNSTSTNLCGKFNILESAAFLKNMDLAISLDTGAMHLAYAVTTPVITLMSTRDLTNKWYPYGSNNIVIEKVLDCSFCFKNDCDDNICMKNITVEEVYSEFLKFEI